MWARGEMIVKVKEPLPQGVSPHEEGQLLYTYFHFAASEELTRACLDRGIVALAYETVRRPTGRPSPAASEVAGRMAGLMGSYYLGRAHGQGAGCPGLSGVARGGSL